MGWIMPLLSFYKDGFGIKQTSNNNNNNKRNRIVSVGYVGERDETIYHLISEWSKLLQREYKIRYEWVGKVIHRELCKKL